MKSSERAGGWKAKRRTGPAADAAASSPLRSASTGTSSRTKSPFCSTIVAPPRPSSQRRARALDLDLEVAPARRRPQLVDGAVGGDPAAGDDHDVLADVLDEVELVAGEDNPDAGRRPLAEDLGHRRDPDRVEAGERLVEDEQLRVVDERRAQLDALLVAVRQRLELVPLAVGQAQPGEPAGGRRGCFLAPASRGAGRSSSAARRRASGGRGRAARACSRSGAGSPGRSAGRASSVSPLSGVARPKMQRIVVVLPAPLGPRKPTIRPGRAVNEAPSRATTSP